MFRNVLLGTDGSPSATQALGRAIELARESGGRIGILGVAPSPPKCLAMAPFALPVSRVSLAAELVAEAQRHVDEAERAVPDDVPVTKLVAHGDAAAALLAHALRGPWDLIVVGHGSPGGRRPLHRSVGTRLLRTSPVPVLVVRGDDAQAPLTAERSVPSDQRLEMPSGARIRAV